MFVETVYGLGDCTPEISAQLGPMLAAVAAFITSSMRKDVPGWQKVRASRGGPADDEGAVDESGAEGSDEDDDPGVTVVFDDEDEDEAEDDDEEVVAGKSGSGDGESLLGVGAPVPEIWTPAGTGFARVVRKLSPKALSALVRFAIRASPRGAAASRRQS